MDNIAKKSLEIQFKEQNIAGVRAKKYYKQIEEETFGKSKAKYEAETGTGLLEHYKEHLENLKNDIRAKRQNKKHALRNAQKTLNARLKRPLIARNLELKQKFRKEFKDFKKRIRTM